LQDWHFQVAAVKGHDCSVFLAFQSGSRQNWRVVRAKLNVLETFVESGIVGKSPDGFTLSEVLSKPFAELENPNNEVCPLPMPPQNASDVSCGLFD